MNKRIELMRLSGLSKAQILMALLAMGIDAEMAAQAIGGVWGRRIDVVRRG